MFPRLTYIVKERKKKQLCTTLIRKIMSADDEKEKIFATECQKKKILNYTRKYCHNFSVFL